MARRQLSRAAIAVGVLSLGAAVEATAPAFSPWLTALDLVVGGVLGVSGAWLLARAPVAALVAVAVSVTWFLGTLAGGPTGLISDVGSACALLYRGPLLQLLLGIPTGTIASRHLHVLAGASWVAAVLPLAAARPATACAAALISVVAASHSRRAAADQRRALLAGAAAALLLASVWTLAIVDPGGGTALLVLDDLAVMGAGSVALFAAAGAWSRRAVSTIVVELGPGRPGRPVSAQLARALADPALEVLYRVPGIGWVDEEGEPSNGPDGEIGTVTRASAPGGGEVALVHGNVGATDPRLAQAAAAAAALVLDAARLEAEVRTRSGEVRASRRRLLTVADAERRSLEGRLSDDVLVPLRSVERMLAPHHDTAAFVAALRDTIAEVTVLGRGLYPPALIQADFAAALADLGQRCPAEAEIEVLGDIDRLPDQLREAAWFVCSEALVNVARHADASRVTVRAVEHYGAFVIEITDDGRGGARITRGLRGLADRVEALGGTLVLESPPGGPTVVRAQLGREMQGTPV